MCMCLVTGQGRGPNLLKLLSRQEILLSKMLHSHISELVISIYGFIIAYSVQRAQTVGNMTKESR